MATKSAEFPKVRTSKEFKDKVFKACEENSVTYAQAVRILMQNLINGTIRIEVDEDYAFVQSAKVVLESEDTKNAIDEFLGVYDPDRPYGKVKKA